MDHMHSSERRREVDVHDPLGIRTIGVVLDDVAAVDLKHDALSYKVRFKGRMKKYRRLSPQ